MSVTHQMYGLLKTSEGSQYFMFDQCNHIIVPQNLDYTTNGKQMTIDTNLKSAQIDMYMYHTDLTTTSNEERVVNMKNFILDKKISKIYSANNEYVVGVDYEIYNNEGKLIKSGSSGILAKYCHAVILNEIRPGNILDYRKACLLDAFIQLDIPQIARYGIKCPVVQYPYIVKITKLHMYATLGDTWEGIDTESQINDDYGNYHSSYASYEIHKDPHCHCEYCHNNFASPFMTNAHLGTSIIDQLVVPAVLEIPYESPQVCIGTIELGDDYRFKINSDVNVIGLNIEVLVDNFNIVYDKEDINEILKNTPEDSDNTDNTDDTNSDNADDTGVDDDL